MFVKGLASFNRMNLIARTISFQIKLIGKIVTAALKLQDQFALFCVCLSRKCLELANLLTIDVFLNSFRNKLMGRI